jgi:hypothetical protein
MLEHLIKAIKQKYTEAIKVIYADENYTLLEPAVKLKQGTDVMYITLPIDKIPVNSRLELEKNNREFISKGKFIQFLRSL